MKISIRCWRIITIIALMFLTAGLILTIYNWHYVCSVEEFRHALVIAATSFITGILFEMVTGLFHKAEQLHHYDH